MTYAGISPKGPNDYTGPKLYGVTIVTRNREPSGADYRQPENGKLYPIGSWWIISIDPTSGVQGDLWYLSKIVANVAYWVKVSGGSAGPLIEIEVDSDTAPGVNPVTPDGTGLITFNGNIVAPHSVPIETNTTALNEMSVDLQISSTSATTDATKNGVAHFDSSSFTIDANGFVTLSGGGGPAIDSINVDANTAPGTDPVVSNGSGQITMTGAQVAAGVIGANAIRTDSLAANSLTIEIQRSAASASSSVNNNGIASFNSTDFTVDPNGYVSATTAIVTPGVKNLGVKYSAGTFTVTSQNGTALSATNPAFVTIQNSSSPGLLVTITLTADQTFTDAAGTNTLSGNLFGMVSGDDFSATDIPFFLYATINSAASAVVFMIGRAPGMQVSPVGANIGKSGTPGANVQYAMFAMGNPTIADYASQPTLMIGSFRMRKSNAGAFTVQTLANQDGIGLFQQEVYFTIPKNTFGAAASSFWYASGGTAPQFNNENYFYNLSPNGMCTLYYDATTVTVDGVGAGQTGLATPWIGNGPTLSSRVFNGEGQLTGGTTKRLYVGRPVSQEITLIYLDTGGSGNLANANLTAATITSITISGTYPIKIA